MTMVAPTGTTTATSMVDPVTASQQTPSLFALSSPEVPYPDGPPPPSRSYSVMGPITERSVQQQQQYMKMMTPETLPWWQYYYQLYQYHPPPGRKPTVFGPYLLLHTLGEGEFGKVKLGIHIESGHEVAIKLIKKDHIDSTTRMGKVKREISVLRTVCHPYIVKLYDVIETDRYIGIILQCASGGELFEYILAHRYLKERDACRLFAQLISGVHYMHQKHIVHRDLKLENLLLDRHRNIIITDFGFANQFGSAKDDLMATSCGSPCYAAPELVVSEGMYVGSAVDIWSCGVILYAMLCGYLPFDDDPENPDGDNINLLYKYILNTPLAFPEYVSADARDLLQKMLVPDPAKRCTMKTIMEHNWLRDYRDLFNRTIEELEAEAMRTADLPIRALYAEDNVQPTESAMDVHRDTTPTPAESVSMQESTEPKTDDAVVPENNDMDVDTEPDPHQNAPASSPMEVADAVAVEPPVLTISSKQSAESEQSQNECQVKGTITATNLGVPEISSFELPASMHSAESTSESAADKTSDVPESGVIKQSAREINTTAQPPTDPSPTDPSPQGSILQAKFLSSLQRQTNNNSHHHQEENSVGAVSMSTSNIPSVPTATTTTTTAHRHRTPSAALTPTSPQQPPPRGTRRKALSLLVNSMADHLQPNDAATRSNSMTAVSKRTMPFSRKHTTRERAQSVNNHNTTTSPYHQRYSGFKRVVGNKDREMHIMPSVSEQTIVQEKEKHKSAGKKLMEWFKKRPLSTRHPDLLHGSSERPLSSFQHPLRAMPLGKSYAVDFNDAKLRTHHGAVDQDALTSRPPVEVLVDIKQALLVMGIDVKKDGEYKVKCVRQRRKRTTPSSQTPSSSSTCSSSRTITDKKRRMSTSAPLRKLLRRSNPADTIIQHHQQGTAVQCATIYGDPVVDPGEEVRFSVEVCKIKNLPGLYIVDIRRMRGNVWAYKFLYHTLLETLNLSGKGGYIGSANNSGTFLPTPGPTSSSSSSSGGQQQYNQNRHSSASSGGSSSVLEDVKEEED